MGTSIETCQGIHIVVDSEIKPIYATQPDH